MAKAQSMRGRKSLTRAATLLVATLVGVVMLWTPGARQAEAVLGAEILSTNPAPLREDNLDGAAVVVQITDAVFKPAAEIEPNDDDFTLTSRPEGTTIAAVERVSDTRVRLTLSFTGEDFDQDQLLQVTVRKFALVEELSAASTQAITVTAVVETFQAQIVGTLPAPLTESNLNGAMLTVDVTGAEFQTGINGSNFTLSTKPQGAAIDGATRVSATRATVSVVFDGTPFGGVNQELAVTILKTALVDEPTALTTNRLTVTAVAAQPTATLVLPQSIPELTEANLDGATIFVDLANASWNDPLPSPPELGFEPFFEGGESIPVAVSTAVRNGPQRVTLTLDYTGADFDGPIGLKMFVFGTAFGGADLVSVNALTVQGLVESAAITPIPSPLTEANLAGAQLQVDLTNATFNATLGAANFGLTGTLPMGAASITGVVRDSATRATLTLAYNGADFDTSATVGVTVLASAHTRQGAIPAPPVPVAAVVEQPAATIISTNPGSLTERNLDGAKLVVELTDVTYNATLTPEQFTLNSSLAPDHLTVADVVRATNRRATVTLAFDGFDFETDTTLSVTVAALAHSGNTSLPTGTVPIDGRDEAAAIILTNPATLTEANMNGAQVVVGLTDAAYRSSLVPADFDFTTTLPVGALSVRHVVFNDPTLATVTLDYDGTDFDTDRVLSVVVRGTAYDTGNGPDLETPPVPVTGLLTPELFITVPGPSDPPLREGTLDEAKVVVEVNDAEFVATPDVSQFTLIGNPPAGLSIASVSRAVTAPSVLVITLAYDGTDFDVERSLRVRVAGPAFGAPADTTLDTTNAVPILAFFEPVTATLTPIGGALTETTLNGAVVEVLIDETIFAIAANLGTEDFNIEQAPPMGTLNITSVQRFSDRRARLTLFYDGTDFDTDAPLQIRVLGSALQNTNDFVFSDTINIVAIEEPSDTDLSALTLTNPSTTISPAFDPLVDVYSAVVGSGTAGVDVTATTVDPGATLRINGVSVLSGQSRTVLLPEGSTSIILVDVTAPDQSTRTYTVQVTRPSSDNRSLRSLTLTNPAAALDPAFSPTTTIYTALTVTGTPSIDLTPVLGDPDASFTVDVNTDTTLPALGTDGQPHTLPLKEGLNEIAIQVTSADTSAARTYRITVVVGSPPPADTSLAALALVAPATPISPAFDPATLTYTAQVSPGVETIELVAAATVPVGTSIMINGVGATSGESFPLALEFGINPVTIIVTGGLSSTVYSLEIERLGSGSPLALASLALVAPDTVLTPAFDPTVFAYTADVPLAVDGVSVLALAVEPTVTLTVKLNDVIVPGAEGGVPLALTGLQPGANTITVDLTAPGFTPGSYEITVTRDASGLSPVDDLSALSLAVGPTPIATTPVFTPANAGTYTVTVPNAASAIEVTATPVDPAATFTLSVNGGAAVTGTAGSPTTLPLTNVAPTVNTITIVVTAENNLDSRAYTIGVTRSSNAPGTGTLTDLGALRLENPAADLSPAFEPLKNGYLAAVPEGTTSIDVIAAPADPLATFTVDVDTDELTPAPGTPLGPTTLALQPGVNTIRVVVTAEAGQSRTYNIRVTVASNDATLANLALQNPATALTPAFDSLTLGYTADVAMGVTSIDVMPTLSDPSATLGVDVDTDGAGPVAGQSGVPTTLPLEPGLNTISVTVTPSGGGASLTYMIEVTREQPAAIDTELVALSLTSPDTPLSPAFDPAVLGYSAAVASDVASVAVSATPADPGATLTLNGAVIPSGTAVTTPLAVGDNTLTIVVTAATGGSRTYTLTVTRAAPVPSSNARLATLTLSTSVPVGLTPVFDPASGGPYTVTVPNAVDTIDVTATPEDAAATFTVDVDDPPLTGPVPGTPGVAVTLPLEVGTNTIDVLVTAEDGTTTMNFQVLVERSAATPGTLADLGSLTLSNPDAPLTPAFDPAVQSYGASVPAGTPSIDVSATPADPLASLTIDGADPMGAPVSVALVDGANAIAIVVTPEDGTAATKTYTVTVTRPAVASSDASLSALALDNPAAPLAPAFDTAVFAYTTNVTEATASIDVIATPSDAFATFTVDVDTDVAAAVAGTPSVPVTLPLALGDNLITVAVTAEDGTPQAYEITVTRAAPPPSTNADLAALELLNPATPLSPAFDAGVTAYTAQVVGDTVDLQATLADPLSTFTVSVNSEPEQPGTSGAPLTLTPLPLGLSSISVVVTPESGAPDAKTYTILLTRLSQDADLASLELASPLAVLDPAFDPAVLSYTAGAAAGTTSIDVVASTADAGATFEVRLNLNAPVSGTDGVPLTLSGLVEGSNTIEVTVTPESGALDARTYTIDLTVAGPTVPTPSTVDDLASLTLSAGAQAIGLTPAFDPAVGGVYTATVPDAASSVDLTATLLDPSASFTVAINGGGAAPGVDGAPTTLALTNTGATPNTIAVVVTAEDTAETRTYTVEVTRLDVTPGDLADLGSLALSAPAADLSPAFDPTVEQYSADLPDTTQVDVTAFAADPAASVSIDGVGVGAGGTHTVSGLTAGSNSVDVVVVSADTSVTRTYTLQLNVIVMPIDVEATLVAPVALTEQNLDGAQVEVTLTNGTFVASPDAVNFLVNGVAGASVSSVVRDSDTQATLTLAFDGTDFDADAALSVTVEADAHSGDKVAITNTAPVQAFVEGPPDPGSGVVVALATAALAEDTLDGATVVVSVNGGTFTDPLDASHFTVNGVAGATPSNVVRESATLATLTLAFDGTDFDLDRDLSITVSTLGLNGDGPATTGTVVVTAVVEPSIPVTATLGTPTPDPLTESGLDGATLPVSITDTPFAVQANLDPLQFTLTGAPAGVTVGAVTRVDDTTVELTLAFDGTDFNTRHDVDVTIDPAALAGGGPVTTTNTIAIIGEEEGAPGPGSVTAALAVVAPTDLTEGNLAGAVVAVSVTGATFVVGPTNLDFTPVGPATVDAVTRVNDTLVLLTLGLAGDFDVDTTLAITVETTALTAGGPATTGTVPVTAVDEGPGGIAAQIVQTTPDPLTEFNLHDATLAVEVTGDTFVDVGTLAPSQFTTDLPEATVSAVLRESDTRVTLTVAFDEVLGDFDVDTTLSVSIDGAALQSAPGTPVTTNAVPVAAVIEGPPAPGGAVTIGIASVSPDPLTETNLSQATLVVEILRRSGELWAVAPTPNDFTLNGPAGTSIQSVTRLSDFEVELTLAYDGTDIVADTPLSVTAMTTAFDGDPGSASTGEVTVLEAASVVTATISPVSLNEAALDTATVDVTVAGDTFVVAPTENDFALQAPAGVTITGVVADPGGQVVTLTLGYDHVTFDFDTLETLRVQVLPGALVNGGTATTNALFLVPELGDGDPSGQLDNDGDLFSNELEAYLGTDPDDGCGVNAWPPDLNDSGAVNVLDAFPFLPLGRTVGDPDFSPRVDFNANGNINVLDAFLLLPLGSTCTP